jgi:hypothetical protein
MLHDPDNPEDVLKVDTDESGVGGDDPYDAWRYGLMEAGTLASSTKMTKSFTEGYRGI